jgi:transglutaminase-like putative cysteine protease
MPLNRRWLREISLVSERQSLIYSVRHVTTFGYDPPIRESVMEVRMQPRSEAHQRCLTFYLDVVPRTNVMVYRDFSGNLIHHFDIPRRHARARVTAQALVEVQPMPEPQVSSAGGWQDLDKLIATGDFWEALLPSHFAHNTDLLQEISKELKLARTDSLLEFVLALNTTLYKAFDYRPNSTDVDSPIDDALRTRAGVCQDFAHIMIAVLRQFGVPSRYVSGYLFHSRHTSDRSPESATHAWVEAFVPGPGWVGLDPTNNILAGERHIRVAIGRDYADVPPTRGVYKGESANELSVSVTVTPSDAPPPEDIPPATVIRTRPAGSGDASARQFDQQQQQQQ